MDWFAIASLGAFPAPASTSTQRAVYYASWGFLDFAPVIVSAGLSIPTVPSIPSMPTIINWFRSIF